MCGLIFTIAEFYITIVLYLRVALNGRRFTYQGGVGRITIEDRCGDRSWKAAMDSQSLEKFARIRFVLTPHIRLCVCLMLLLL